MTYAIKTGTDDQGNDIYFNQVEGSVDVVNFESDEPQIVDTLIDAEDMLIYSKFLAAMFDDTNPDAYDFEIVEVNEDEQRW